MIDLVIRNGWIADGTGSPLRPADLAIAGDRIVHVGRLPNAEAVHTIDAAGRIVCPGFVDCHSHSDSTILLNPTAQSTIRQGITTEVVGNCGDSPAPLAAGGIVADDPLGLGGGSPPTWSTFAGYLDAVRATGIAPNMAWFVGHNTVRRAAGVLGRQVTAKQIAVMRDFVREAMDASALGLSTGLEFDPGRRATTRRSSPWLRSSARETATTPATSATARRTSSPPSMSSSRSSGAAARMVRCPTSMCAPTPGQPQTRGNAPCRL